MTRIKLQSRFNAFANLDNFISGGKSGLGRQLMISNLFRYDQFVSMHSISSIIWLAFAGGTQDHVYSNQQISMQLYHLNGAVEHPSRMGLLRVTA